MQGWLGNVDPDWAGVVAYNNSLLWKSIHEILVNLEALMPHRTLSCFMMIQTRTQISSLERYKSISVHEEFFLCFLFLSAINKIKYNMLLLRNLLNYLQMFYWIVLGI